MTEHTHASSSADTTDDVAIVATNVHITYRAFLDAHTGLRDRLKKGFRKSAPRFRDVHAVRGVSLTLHRGESLGIVGSNGSGKSTLLTGLAGLIELDQGEVLATSRPKLLGVGAVLNGKLSGRRNIEMGCLALGLSNDEVRLKVDEVCDFTGLADSIDLPLRTFSSGMRARLAFAVATAVRPDILLIDEALAVGDRRFRARATERLLEIQSSAGAVIVVSHSISDITHMCSRVVWLENGQVVADGATDEVLELYQESNPEIEPTGPRARNRQR